MKFDFDDIVIQPAVVSDINSRSDIKIYDENNMLPLFMAPMLDVAGSIQSRTKFLENKIYPVVPRNQLLLVRNHDQRIWVALSLEQFKEWIDNFVPFQGMYYNVIIDIANGHQQQLIELINSAKEKINKGRAAKKVKIMVGNVGNPQTYVELSEAGANFIRLGIGNGSGCLTTEQTGIGYPMGSLIYDTYNESLSLKNPAKIVADGGMRKYSDIIKALALGADYIMIGGMFNKALESSGDTYLWKRIKVNQHSDLTKWLFFHNFKLYKKFRGMSTKEVQTILGNKILKTSEGITKYNKVKYDIAGWVDNLEHYLRSAMSYCGARTLEEFVGNTKTNLISTNAYRRFNK